MYIVNLNTYRVSQDQYVDLNDPNIKIFKSKKACVSFVNALLRNLHTLSLSTKDNAKRILINVQAQKLKNSAVGVL